MSRGSALARLAAAYARHQLARRIPGRSDPDAGDRTLLGRYAEDRLLPVTRAERTMLPAVAGCISCGLCALVAGRSGGLLPSDLAASYLRDYPALGAAAGETAPAGEPGLTEAERSALEAAAAVCPTGVPLPGVLEMIRRLATA